MQVTLMCLTLNFLIYHTRRKRLTSNIRCESTVLEKPKLKHFPRKHTHTHTRRLFARGLVWSSSVHATRIIGLQFVSVRFGLGGTCSAARFHLFRFTQHGLRVGLVSSHFALLLGSVWLGSQPFHSALWFDLVAAIPHPYTKTHAHTHKYTHARKDTHTHIQSYKRTHTHTHPPA